MSVRRAAVIGGGVAGLTAAGLLTRAGMKVTLFERARELGGKAARLVSDGLTLDLGPTLLTMPSTVRETFQLLDAGDLLPRFHELSSACAYRYPNGQGFEAHRDVEAFAREVRSLGERESDGLRRFYAEAERIYAAAGTPFLKAPFEGMAGFMARVAKQGLSAVTLGMQMGTLSSLGERYFRSPELRQFVNRFATYVGASPFQASAAFALIPHLERAEGVWHPEGGMGNLALALAEAVRRLGVDFVLGVKAQVQHRAGETLAGPPGDLQRFDAVVVNEDPLTAGVGDASTEQDVELGLSGYVMLLGVDRRLALPHHTVFFSADDRAEFDAFARGQLPGEQTLYVCHPAATDASMAPSGRSGLFVMANAPAFPLGTSVESAREQWAKKGAHLRAAVLQRLERELPELRGHYQVLQERTPVDFLERGAPGGSLYGVAPHGKFGPFRRPRMRTSWPNVFYAGGGTHPGGGVPMVMLSGRFAAGMVRESLARRSAA